MAELRTEGIDVTDVATLDGVSTGTALIVVDRKGENQIAVGAGANAAVDPAAVRTAVARAAGWAGCVLVSAEVTPDAVVAAVESAASHRIPCVLNPAPVTSGLVELFGLGPVLTPNSSELGELRTLLGEHGTVRFRTWRLTGQLARRLLPS